MGLSRLIDPTIALVVDSSTVININATANGSVILRAIPNPIVVTDVVLLELTDDRRNGRQDGQIVRSQLEAGLVSLERLGDLTESHFEELVIGDGKATLDDGEAATIACAVEKGAVAVIDERKATNLCKDRYPSLTVINSIDILSHPAVVAELGQQGTADAVYNALLGARMRVPFFALDWVVDLIGKDRASMCESLPRARRTRP